MNPFKSLGLMFSFVIIALTLKGQGSGSESVGEFKWTMIGINRLHVQDFNPIDKATPVLCCGQKTSYLDKAGITLGFGMYQNLTSRFALALDLGATYGGMSSTDPAKSDPSKGWSQTLRTDGYFHFGNPYAAIRPYGFAGIHAQQRKGSGYLSTPVGAGIRYAPNPMAIVTAQVGYGIGVAGKVNQGIYYSWGVYIKVNRQKKDKDDGMSFGGLGGQAVSQQAMASDTTPKLNTIDSIPSSPDTTRIPEVSDSATAKPFATVEVKKDSIPQVQEEVKIMPQISKPVAVIEVKKDSIPQAGEVLKPISQADKKDGDGDGVPDERDLCPTVPGSPDNAGCPIKDKDGDGIPDDYDQCPDAPGEKSRGGCPDSTLLVPQTTKGKVKSKSPGAAVKKGSSPRDVKAVREDIPLGEVKAVNKDNISSDVNTVKKEIAAEGVVVVKKTEEVSSVAVVKKDIVAVPKVEVKPVMTLENNDRDADGVPNDRDLCPDVAGSTSNSGCPIKDQDGDGVPDMVDQCPTEPGDKSRAGCPDPSVVSTYVRIPKDTIRLVIYFDVDKYSLTQNSFEVLSMAVDILKRNPGFTCSLFGHSDIEGDTDYNLRLSENRVKVARNYVFSYGINPDRIITAAFGKSQFVIGQQDKSLTWMNRRVEILIVKY